MVDRGDESAARLDHRAERLWRLLVLHLVHEAFQSVDQLLHFFETGKIRRLRSIGLVLGHVRCLVPGSVNTRFADRFALRRARRFLSGILARKNDGGRNLLHHCLRCLRQRCRVVSSEPRVEARHSEQVRRDSCGRRLAFRVSCSGQRRTQMSARISGLEFVIEEMGGYQRALGFAARARPRRGRRRCRKGSPCLPPLPARTARACAPTTPEMLAPRPP